MIAAAVLVLAGGHSQRMGRDKAAFALGNESMLGRTVR
ncbi:MAG: NTP transferase domain-containing protein, partial [Cyanobacteria bacterium J06641_5]